MTKQEVIQVNTQTQHQTIEAALCAAQMEMGPALKQSNNPAFRAKYADLGNVMDACLPALNRHGIAVIQPIGEDDRGRFVDTVLVHTAGQLRCRVPLIVTKNDMQGFGSAVTYARRYGLMAMAGIAPEDDDGAAASKAAPRQERQETSLVDDMGEFVAAVTQACLALEMAQTVDALNTVWKGLRPDVRADAKVIQAGKDRKAALISYSDIPYEGAAK